MTKYNKTQKNGEDKEKVEGITFIVDIPTKLKEKEEETEKIKEE